MPLTDRTGHAGHPLNSCCVSACREHPRAKKADWFPVSSCPGLLDKGAWAAFKLMTMRQRWAAEAALDKAGSDANWADCRRIASELGIPYDQVGTPGALWCRLRLCACCLRPPAAAQSGEHLMRRVVQPEDEVLLFRAVFVA